MMAYSLPEDLSQHTEMSQSSKFQVIGSLDWISMVDQLIDWLSLNAKLCDETKQRKENQLTLTNRSSSE